MTRAPVLVLHGLGRRAASMAPMARALERAGFVPTLLPYPSTRHTVGELLDRIVGPAVDAALAGGAPVHFVTHSLGGVLVRAEAARRFDAGEALPAGSRAVFLAPPFAGSEAADRLRELRAVRAVLGPVLHELGTDDASVPRALGPVRGLEAGVIAGTRRLVPFNRLFAGANDGLVSVDSATSEAGLADTLVLPATHALVMRHPVVVRQTVRFLVRGAFDHPLPRR